MTCKECPYLWKEEEDKYPCCHYHSLGTWDPAPCEREEEDEEYYYTEEEDYE